MAAATPAGSGDAQEGSQQSWFVIDLWDAPVGSWGNGSTWETMASPACFVGVEMESSASQLRIGTKRMEMGMVRVRKLLLFLGWPELVVVDDCMARTGFENPSRRPWVGGWLNRN